MRQFGSLVLKLGLAFFMGGLSLASADDFSLSGLEFAKATAKKAPEQTAMAVAPVKTQVAPGVWLAFSAGYNFANLGDLGAAAKNLDDFAAAGGDKVGDGTSGNGIQAGLALGVDLDKSDSLSLSVENTWTNQVGLNITSGGDAGARESFDPSLLGIKLNYELVIAQGGGSKTSFIVGAGFYHGAVDYYSDITPYGSQTITGNFGQDGVGGTVGVSEKLDLGGSLEFGASANFQAADFGKLTSNQMTENGTTSSSGGPFVLVTDHVNDPYTTVEPVPTSAGAPPSGYNYTDLDYTGFNADLSLTLHL